MRQHTIYTCEICETEYRHECCAQYCEAQFLDPCPVKVGDKVLVYDRYGPPKEDIIISVKIGANITCDFLDDWVSNWDNHPVISTHSWTLVMNSYHQIGKDESTDEVDLRHVCPLNENIHTFVWKDCNDGMSHPGGKIG